MDAKKLFWLDLEMSGLEVETNVIIEVAAIVTDFELNRLDSYQAVVNQPQSYIDQMDDWNTNQHTKSGLIQRIPSGKQPTEVEGELINLVDKHFDEPAVLAGNSIHKDRQFVDKYFVNFSSRLHYRMLDVTAWKVMFSGKYGVTVDKKESHRALDDIEESIDELAAYLSHVKV